MDVSELYHYETQTEMYIDDNNDHHPLKIMLYHNAIVVPILPQTHCKETKQNKVKQNAMMTLL